MGLAEYRRKRNFKATPEPQSGETRGGRSFVVQLHHASHRHFDFRLELDGVLKSWAVPKGPSFDPAVKRLAMEVEDHPVSYADFEGDIPTGHYGAGHVDIFDSGTWEPQGNARNGLRDGELKFILNGDVLRGSWVLVRTRKQGTKQQWLLIKHRDEYAGPRDADAFVDPRTDRPVSLAQRRKTWPSSAKTPAKRLAAKPSRKASASKASGVMEVLRDEAFSPQLCRSLAKPPTGADWLHEVKWDGYRILATVVAGKVRLWSRNGIEWTHKIPEIANAIDKLGVRSAQFDGEMIVLRDGSANFNALQARLSGENREPLVYMLFDLPHLDGKSLRRVPLVERKAKLAALLKANPRSALRYSEHQIGHGAAVFVQAVAAGIEGIVSKRISSSYHGSRTGDWVKAKGRPSDEFIVVGFTEPKANRAGLGALLLASPRQDGLRYVGRVGTGLSGELLRTLRKQLASDVVAAPSADMSLMERKDRPLAIWVKPKLVVEVFFQGVGGKGLLRHVAFKALRADKKPTDLQEALVAARTPISATTAKHRPRAEAPSSDPGSTPRRSRPDATRKSATEEVVLTHPDRIVFPGSAISKRDVADYYRAVAGHLLAEIADRPLSVLRCPDGAGKACFFQKHLTTGLGEHVYSVDIREKAGTNKYLCIRDAQGLLELVQMNVLEFHPWGAQANDIEHANRIVFDLDPHASVTWARVVAAAREVHKQLASIGLVSFVRTSGGKGLHVVVPLDPPATWDTAKAFAQAVAEAMVALHPTDYVSVAGEKKRKGKIFIDWLRNGRGATSVASYSLRARAAAGVAMPLAWTELARVESGDAFTITNAVARLRRRRQDPWKTISSTRQSLPEPQQPRPAIRRRRTRSQSRP